MCGGMKSEEVVVDVEEPFFFRRIIRVLRFLLVEGSGASLSVMVDGWGGASIVYCCCQSTQRDINRCVGECAAMIRMANIQTIQPNMSV